MANLFTRLKHTVLADLHEVLDQKESKNPIGLLNQYLRECEVETEKVRKLLERQYTLKQEFEKEYKYSLDLALKRKNQADIAAKAGEIELTQFAQSEQQQYEERASRLKIVLEKALEQLHDLERKYEDMQHKLKEMNIRRLELMGRENVTRAHQQIDKVLVANTYSDGANSHFEEIERYLDRLEKQVHYSYNQSTIDVKIAQLEKELKKEEILSK